MKSCSIFTIGRVDIVMMSVFSKSINQFNAISIKIQPSNFLDIKRLILKFIWKNQKVQNRQENT